MKSKTYDEFVEKFKPKKTTDDCYTPPIVYEAIKNWACSEYGINESDIVRPFYPGGDYKTFKYEKNSVVLDNPPFSILTQICEFYLDNGIKFFLFAPTLTCLGGKNTVMRMNHIICDYSITYENGARVNTSFVTNLTDDIVLQSSPELRKVIEMSDKENLKSVKAILPQYKYPDHVITSAIAKRYSKYGVSFKVSKKDCVKISKLDSQSKFKKAIFGGGLLLSNKAAADRIAAEDFVAKRAVEIATERLVEAQNQVIAWGFSERELKIVKELGR